MEKDAKNVSEKKQLNDTMVIDRVGIYVDADMEELDKLASKKSKARLNLTIIIAFILFLIVCISSVVQIYNYIERRKLFSETNKVVNVDSKDASLSIMNNGSVPSYLSKSLINQSTDEASVENINELTLNVSKNAKNKVTYRYNVRYRINKNGYDYLDLTTDPILYVRFSYSKDGKTWEYVNSAISTTNSTLMPSMSNNYDISGLETTLNVATNVKISGNPGEKKKIYWRAETIYRHILDVRMKDKDKDFVASFTTEYNY